MEKEGPAKGGVEGNDGGNGRVIAEVVTIHDRGV